MAFAPLDVWARLLRAGPVGPRYWPRLAFALFSSTLATALTLPERLVLGVIRPWRRARPPAVIVIVGYYRTGTTHLHYLLSCDPALRTPAWCETLAPQGYAFSWLFLRIFMIPFVSSRRPQDDVAIGPGWPAEDDFALNNWGLASSLPGRFVIPSKHDRFSRYHDLVGLTDRERARWAELQRAFIWKVASLARGRSILLKTPSHTARLGALRELLGPGVKFVHMSRDPAAVVRSNVSMAARLSLYNLEDGPGEGEVRRRVVEEYLATEAAYERDRAGLPPGACVEVRYEDVVADPLGQLRRIYGELGLAWTEAFEARARSYLASVRGYRAANSRGPGEGGEVRAEDPALEARLLRLRERFGHDRPAVEAGPSVNGPVHSVQVPRGLLTGLAMSVLVLIGWCAQAYVLGDRHDWLVWPAGVLIGWSALRGARGGRVLLGVSAAVLTLLVYAAVAVPGTFLSDYARRPDYAGWWRGNRAWPTWEWFHILKAARAGAISTANLFWLLMGVVTAYRFGSRQHLDPPGRG